MSREFLIKLPKVRKLYRNRKTGDLFLCLYLSNYNKKYEGWITGKYIITEFQDSFRINDGVFFKEFKEISFWENRNYYKDKISVKIRVLRRKLKSVLS